MTGWPSVSSPKRAANAWWAASSRCWPGKKTTFRWSQMRRISAIVSSSTSRRSTPLMAAPIEPERGVTSRSMLVRVSVISVSLSVWGRLGLSAGVSTRRCALAGLVEAELSEQTGPKLGERGVAPQPGALDVHAQVEGEPPVSQDHHPVGQENRLVDIVGYEQDGGVV